MWISRKKWKRGGSKNFTSTSQNDFAQRCFRRFGGSGSEFYEKYMEEQIKTCVLIRKKQKWGDKPYYYIIVIGKETPYGILSVDDAITLNSFYHLDKIKQILLYHGYQYETSFETDDYTYDYWTKDCKLGRSTYGYELSSGSEKSSYAELGGAGVHVYAYDESVFKAWYSQIVALGYKIDSESQKGNHGQDWIAEKEGEPEISIWNDYGDTYILYVVGNE